MNMDFTVLHDCTAFAVYYMVVYPITIRLSVRIEGTNYENSCLGEK